MFKVLHACDPEPLASFATYLFDLPHSLFISSNPSSDTLESAVIAYKFSSDLFTMHLINTTDLTLHEYQGYQIPPYGILSHRWEDGEVSMKELRKKRNTDKAGWRKIENCCKLARNWKEPLEYV